MTSIALFVIGSILVGIFAAILFGVWLVVAHAGAGKRQEKAEQDSPRLLDDLFDGTDDVTYAINLESMKYETVLIGAKKRGYRLTHETATSTNSKMLIFERVNQSGGVSKTT